MLQSQTPSPSAVEHNSINGVYAITDPNLSPAGKVLQDAELALKGGVKILQFRDKTTDWHSQLALAKQLKTLCTTYQALLIINDDIELAIQANADGIHLGKDDAALETARQTLGNDKIIGISCYNSIERALEMQKRGANYVAFGRFFPSKTKPNAPQADVATLVQAKQILQIPLVVIGGIELNNAQTLIDAGADSIAVIQGIFAQDDIQAAAQSLSDLFPPHKSL